MHPRHGELLQLEHWSLLPDGYGMLLWRLYSRRHVVLLGRHLLSRRQSVLQLWPVLLITKTMAPFRVADVAFWQSGLGFDGRDVFFCGEIR